MTLKLFSHALKVLQPNIAWGEITDWICQAVPKIKWTKCRNAMRGASR